MARGRPKTTNGSANGATLGFEAQLFLAATRDLLLPILMSGEIRLKDAERALETAL